MYLFAIALLLPLLLLIKKIWVVRIIQVALVLGIFEWTRTLFDTIIMRQEYGVEWTRFALIMGAVLAVTIFSALIFQSKSLKLRYTK